MVKKIYVIIFVLVLGSIELASQEDQDRTIRALKAKLDSLKQEQNLLRTELAALQVRFESSRVDTVSAMLSIPSDLKIINQSAGKKRISTWMSRLDPSMAERIVEQLQQHGQFFPHVIFRTDSVLPSGKLARLDPKPVSTAVRIPRQTSKKETIPPTKPENNLTKPAPSKKTSGMMLIEEYN